MSVFETEIIICCFSTDREPWTGIYYCKGEKHQDQFYCGQGMWALNRKRKIRTCDDCDWSEYGKPIYLGKYYFDFRKLKHYIMFSIISKDKSMITDLSWLKCQQFLLSLSLKWVFNANIS